LKINPTTLELNTDIEVPYPKIGYNITIIGRFPRTNEPLPFETNHWVIRGNTFISRRSVALVTNDLGYLSIVRLNPNNRVRISTSGYKFAKFLRLGHTITVPPSMMTNLKIEILDRQHNLHLAMQTVSVAQKQRTPKNPGFSTRPIIISKENMSNSYIVIFEYLPQNWRSCLLRVRTDYHSAADFANNYTPDPREKYRRRCHRRRS
jgi:hypothetical protein